MNDKIRVNPGRKASTTGESIENALAEAGIVLDYSPTIYMPQKRVNGVYWLALGKRDGAAIAIHGKGVASLAWKQGMILTRYEGNLWHAVANSKRPRRKPPAEELGNALQWEAEPMIDRLNKCLGVLVGYDLVTEAVHKKIRDQISELRQEANHDQRTARDRRHNHETASGPELLRRPRRQRRDRGRSRGHSRRR